MTKQKVEWKPVLTPQGLDTGRVTKMQSRGEHGWAKGVCVLELCGFALLLYLRLRSIHIFWSTLTHGGLLFSITWWSHLVQEPTQLELCVGPFRIHADNETVAAVLERDLRRGSGAFCLHPKAFGS